MDDRMLMVQLARDQVGTTENPAGSNNVLYNTEYYGHAVNGTNYAWCLVFIWWLFHRLGLGHLFYDGKKTAYCPTLQAWAKRIGQTVPCADAQQGDIVFLDWNANGDPDHVGICVGRAANGDLLTVEGNVSDAVRQMQRAEFKDGKRQVCCVWRPSYSPPAQSPYVTRDELREIIAAALEKLK